MPQARRMLTQEEIMTIKELYSRLDARGGRIYPQIKLAQMYGVGETTIYRVVNSLGGYRDTPLNPFEKAAEMQMPEGMMERIQQQIAGVKEQARTADAIVEELVAVGKVELEPERKAALASKLKELKGDK